MGSKRGVIGFVFTISFIIFSIGLVSADHCWAQDSPCLNGEDYTVMHLSDLTNAHGEVWGQHAYDSNWYICCSFSGTHTCDGTNTILRLATPTNAHAQIPSLHTYDYDICFGNLACKAETSPISLCPDSNYSIFMLYLSDTASSGTNTHISGNQNQEPLPTEFLAGYNTRICCGPNLTSSCGNDLIDLGEACDDGNNYDGDGCSYPECQVEPGCSCTLSTPNCCYCTPVSHWFLNSNPVQLSPTPTSYNLRLNDVLTMRFDETFCLDEGNIRTFQIREGTTTIATATATVGTTYTQATYGPIQQSFLNTLGIGHSQIFFRMLDPYASNYHLGYTIDVVPVFCGDGSCNNGETCSTCPGDCGVCPPICPDGICNGVETCTTCSADCGACAPTCSLTSKYWSTSSAYGGNTVQLTVLGNADCNGLPVTFSVYEYDLLGDDDLSQITPLSIIMSGGQATTSWVAEWPDIENEQNPEYYFIPSAGGQSLTSKTPRLSVSEPELCGNGIPDSGETCSNCPADIGVCCGNGVIDSSEGEVCDGGNLNGMGCEDILSDSTGTLACYISGTPNECQFDTTNCITTECAINTASWNETSVNEGTPVKLDILTNNCNDGEIISFVIEESDDLLNPNEDVANNPTNAIVSGNTATGLWTAEWQDDADGGQSNPPEYFFTAKIVSNNEEKVSLDPKLTVNSWLAECTLFSYCSSYTNETDCNNDKCNVAENSVGVTCGSSYDSLTRCMDVTTCGCTWDDSLGTCGSYWEEDSFCGTCGNGVTDFGEQCDDGDNENDDGCSSTCQFEDNILPPCPYGTTLCSDGTCSKNCYFTDTDVATCDYDGFCDTPGESCTCLDCYGNVDTCATELICNIFNVACCNDASDEICDPECSYVDPDCTPAICGNGYMEVGEECDDGNNEDGEGCTDDCKLEVLSTCCVEGTAECEDNTCSLNCYATDAKIIQDGDNCCGGLTFSEADQACCNPISNGMCNPYCSYVDPDCISIPPDTEEDGICTTNDATTDTCDDGILERSLDAIWIWAEGNNYTTNLTEDYRWDETCGTIGCYRYDPIVDPIFIIRKSDGCVDLQDEITCSEQIKINLFGVYSLLAAIVLIVIIYIIFFSRKKKKFKTKRKK
jgi:cysteine-rich repeat protein